MIRLAHQDPQPHLLTALREVSAVIGNVGVARLAGDGPWDQFLPRSDHAKIDYVSLVPGSLKVLPGETDSSTDGSNRTAWIKVVVRKIWLTHTSQPFGIWDNCAILLRPLSYIYISDASPGIYAPMPDATGHEVLEDLERLEAQFPGVFGFNA